MRPSGCSRSTATSRKYWPAARASSLSSATGWPRPSTRSTSTSWPGPTRSSGQLPAGAPLVTEALAQVAHPQIRNRGTICGSLAHADSSAELPAVMLALNARMTIAAASGIRTVGSDEFFLFHMTTAIEPHELLLAVEFDEAGARTYTSFQEF